jgi:ATP-dependent Lon protease
VDVHEDLPLFPISLVLLPDEELPLHIFEPRYRELTARCLANDEPFAIVLAEDDGIRQTGCTARIERVVTAFDDGRSNILIRGGTPVLIRDVHERHAYHSARAEELADAADEPDEATVSAALEAFRVLDEDVPDRGPRLSYRIAIRVSLPAEAKQSLLEDRSEPSRLRHIVHLLQLARRGQLLADEAERRARRNGRVRTADELAAELGL